jgi:trk system potassium uptake protein TrkA
VRDEKTLLLNIKNDEMKGIMLIIIVGAAGIGEALVDKILKEDNHNILVVDKNMDNCNRIAQKYDVVVINGDATQSDVLDECETERADVIVTTTDDDSVNLLAISLAKNKGIKHSVSIVNQEESIPLYMEKGVKLVRDKDTVMARHLKKAIDHPSVEDFINLGNEAEIITLKIDPNSPISDAIINDIQIPNHSLIISIIRDNKLFIPSNDDKLFPGDKITILTQCKLVDEVVKVFSPKI